MFAKKWYETIPKINPSKGTCEISKIENKEFQFFFNKILKESSQIALERDEDEQAFQKQLLTLCRDDEPALRTTALLLLRNFVCHVAKYTIDNLVKKIGNNRELCYDLYRCVLDDDGKPLGFILDVNHPNYEKRLVFLLDENGRLLILNKNGSCQALNKPFSFKVLSTFELDRFKGRNLSNWTELLTWQDKEVQEVLKEYGYSRCTPWSFLPKFKPEELRNLETRFSGLSLEVIELHVYFLKILREIHQKERLEGSEKKPNQKYQKMLAHIQQEGKLVINSIEELEAQLMEIMKIILQAQKNMNNPDSLDLPKHRGSGEDSGLTWKEIIPDEKAENIYDTLEKQELEKLQIQIHEEFDSLYQKKRLRLLARSLKETILHRLNHLQQKSSKQSSQYINALLGFYTQGLSQGEIAPLIGLQYQYQVSRLLKLPDLISDSRLRMLELLRDLCVEWSKKNAETEHQQLIVCNTGFLVLLEEQIDDILNIFEEARQENFHPEHSRNSLFVQQICHCLNHLEN